MCSISSYWSLQKSTLITHYPRFTVEEISAQKNISAIRILKCCNNILVFKCMEQKQLLLSYGYILWLNCNCFIIVILPCVYCFIYLQNNIKLLNLFSTQQFVTKFCTIANDLNISNSLISTDKNNLSFNATKHVMVIVSTFFTYSVNNAVLNLVNLRNRLFLIEMYGFFISEDIVTICVRDEIYF